MKREELEEKVQDLIDGRLSDAEAVEVKRIIEEDEYLKLFYTTLKEVDHELQQQEIMNPSRDFTIQVMSRLHESSPGGVEFKSVWLLVGLVVCIGLGLFFASQTQFDIPDISPVSKQLTVPDQLPVGDNFELTLPGLDLPSSEMLLNVFYFSLMLLALIYFDRAILRPWFRGRRYTV